MGLGRLGINGYCYSIMALPVKHEEDEKVLQLTDRLKKLKSDLREFSHLRHVAGFQVHPLLREEIARLYDEHGGIEIISKLTRISYKTIKEWRAKYKRNPMFFRDMPLHPPFYRPLKQAEEKVSGEQKALIERLKECTLYKEAKTIDEVRSLLPEEVVSQLDAQKKTVDESVEMSHELSSQLKLEIARLVIQAGSPRPVALLLGLNQKVIMSWKALFTLAENRMTDNLPA